MNRTGFLYDERYQLHLTGNYHPEVPERLACVYRGIQEAGLLSDLIHIKASRADMKWIEQVHDGRYIQRFEAACLSGKSMFDSPDNQMCYDTYETALLAVGGILDVAGRVMEGELDNGFCVVGKAAAVSAKNFDDEVGRRVALDDVRNQLWQLLGWRLKEGMFDVTA